MSVLDTGFLQPTLIVEQALLDGLADVDAAAAVDDATIDALLKRMLYSETAKNRAALREWLKRDSPKVLRNFPRDHATFPCWAVLIKSDQETDHFLGEGFHQATYPDGSFGTVDASGWKTEVAIATLAEDPNAVEWLYGMSKFIVSAKRDSMQAAGLQFEEFHLSGQDLGFDRQFLQAGRFVYRRDLYVSASYFNRDAHREPASQVTDTEQTAVVGTGFEIPL